MENRSDILNKIDRRSGMTVPEGYFADFASRMAASLPERQPAAAAADLPRRDFWQRIKPFAYMAAMFAGIWCMMKMFQMMGGAGADLSIDNYPGVVTALSDDSFVKEYVFPTVDEYDLYEDMYETGANPEDYFMTDDNAGETENSLNLPAPAYTAEHGSQSSTIH